MEMDAVAPYRACLVSIAGYNMPNQFIQQVCERNAALVPIAGLDPNAVGGPQAARASIEELRAGGFLGVKLHPRLNGVDVGGRPMRWVLEACMELSFPVLLCTNFTGFSEQDLSSGVTLLRHYLGEFSQLPMVLLHGGFTKMEAVAAKAAASLGVRFPPSS